MVDRKKSREYEAAYRRHPYGRFSSYKTNAMSRELEFNLTFDEFQELVTSRCHYCESQPSNGVDRLDSHLGYETSNVVPCCTKCNAMKSSLDPDDFIAHVLKIAGNWEVTDEPVEVSQVGAYRRKRHGKVR